MELKNINERKNIIEEVVNDSIADELGVKEGDFLLSINNQEVRDIIDYKYLIASEFITVDIEKNNGELWELEIEKEYDEDLGIVFSNLLIDEAKSCKNKCLFCFVDQMPKGMRSTLYFKDDDSRLSFLQGNFVTLTNMSEDEIQRIIKYRLSPINVSVHTTDPKLRVKMLRNKKAGKVYEILKRFSEAEIEMNCQIVLVPGINDGKNLDKTLSDLSKLHPNVASVAVVPVGITKYRENLHTLSTYDNEKAIKVLDHINEKQQKFLKEFNTRFVFASDEFYVLAQRDIPQYDEYEGFPQIENGVGLLRSFYKEVEVALNDIKSNKRLDKEFILVTGVLAEEYMKEISKMIEYKFRGLRLKVIPIKNYFFGETITVSGLITGSDLINQLKEEEIKGDYIIIPRSMMKSGEDVFLDDVTVEEVSHILGTKVIISDVKGKEFINIFNKISEVIENV